MLLLYVPLNIAGNLNAHAVLNGVGDVRSENHFVRSSGKAYLREDYSFVFVSLYYLC